VVWAVLQGKEWELTVKVALDTGASITLIPWEVAEQLGYEPS